MPTSPASPTSAAAEAYGAGADVVLSTWRRRARPMEAIDRQMHQAILRAFARTGQPPASADLDAITDGTGRTTTQVLKALHDMDAIRLATDGRIAVAYPFSASPTRHRVRIGGSVDVHAMCAIDALGMAAMLGTDTRIESIDVTSGKPITVTMPAPGSADETRWEPAEVVVFVGADAAGGPSADCCCDYLNFFTSMPAARAWTATHPNVPGQILDRSAAEDLGVELFGSLLS